MIQAVVKKGQVLAEQVPAPVVAKGGLLIKVVNSCISAGTEISGVQGSGRSLIKRAMDQPENLKKALNLVRSEGIVQAYAKIRGKLDNVFPTGYSISGVVIAVGEGVTGFSPGDHVAAAGAGIANHAEYVDVPVNLVMRMPQGMDFKTASTVTLGGIALQGVRRADLRLGEFCVVAGAGILGLLSVQMLVLSGVRVAVSDFDERRLEIARELGAELTLHAKDKNLVSLVNSWSNGFGADAVLFTAATSSNEAMSQSFQMCRKKGRVILVGVAGMQLKREDMYSKELDFLVSTSYGPGRYDKNYEEKGLDYPYAYVRWSENRNMSEYLRLVHQDKIKLEKIIDRIFPITEVTEAFTTLQNSEKKPLIVILDYGQFAGEKLEQYLNHDRRITFTQQPLNKELINVALIGTGNFATGMHLPNLMKLKDKFKLRAVMNRTGLKAVAITKEYGADYATTDYSDILKDPETDLILICTRHDSHADLTLRALQAGKNVFVEKPMATSLAELEKIRAFYEDGTKDKPLLFVGFNRRFSPYIEEIKKHTDKRISPLLIRYRMNAGFIPGEHWVHEDGGRIIGEACHIIDLMSALTGAEVKTISSASLQPDTGKFSAADNKSICLEFADGSLASIEYFSLGNKELSKEFMEIHFDEKSIILDDFRSLKGYGVELQEISTPQSQKGQLEELQALYQALKLGGDWPIPFASLLETTAISIKLS